MTRVVFAEAWDEAWEPPPDTRVVVLDAAWTPARPRDGVVPIRGLVAPIVEVTDLVDGSLDALDAWAEATGMAGRLEADEVTWWPQVRMLIRWDVHELFLWRLVLDALPNAARIREIVVPAGRPALAAAAQAPWAGSGPGTARRRPVVRIVGVGRASSAMARLGRSFRRRRTVARAVRLALLAGRGLRHGAGLLRWLPGPGAASERTAILGSRYEALRKAGRPALAIAWPRSYHVVRAGGDERREDPHLSSPMARLAAAGRPVAVVGLGLDHRRDADWASIEDDPTLLPESFLTGRWIRPLDVLLDSSAVSARVAAAPPAPVPLGDHDLGPAILELVEHHTDAWLDWQRLRLRWADRLVADLRPGVLFTDREASRTAWLAACRRQGIPSVAIQHGMVYRKSPEYWRPSAPTAIRPTTTCVFGEWEREILVRDAGIAADAVVVTGSPRSDTGAGDGSGDGRPDHDRAAVRAELGVAADHRLLVVSVAHNPLMGELHTFCALSRVLGGPLPGVHLVVKLHPQDEAPPRHRALLEGLARAGGYPAPPVTVLRDADIYRLLRAADAHLGQYSTVLTDAVVAGTPNMIVVGQGHQDVLGYVTAGVATGVRSVDDVRSFMADPPRPSDEARRMFLDAHFRPGDATGRVADVLAAAIDAGARP